MKNKPMYHIDVTPEEDRLFRDIEQPRGPKLSQTTSKPISKLTIPIIILIVVIHLVGACALMAFSSTRSISNEDKQFVGEVADSVLDSPVIKQPIAVPSPTATPVPTPEPTPAPTPPANNDVPMDAKPTSSDVPKQTPKPIQVTKHSNLTKEYVVKKGDTIYSIAKKFKLNTEKLLKINNIKDPNKIALGQKLKFM